MAPTPVRVHVRMYQVGFGDCFLLTVEYDEADADGRKERHLLIDFGSTAGPEKYRRPMAKVAEQIEADCGGQLDVVMVTHRHKDHLGGFADNKGAEVMTRLAPKVVLRPWTEDPLLGDDANAPADATAETAVGVASRKFVTRLSQTQKAMEQLATDLQGMHGLAGEVRELALEEVANKEAVDFLDALSADGRGRYLHRGMEVDLTDVVPGLELTVLGPPTLEQDPGIASEAHEHDEFWMLRLQDSLEAAVGSAERHKLPEVEPGPVRWLVQRLASQRLHSVSRLVRKLDDALNNTSLILLLRIGELDLLFPGDAQIENWQATLDEARADEALAQRLANIDLYKVGHHGSRNATPRTLHTLWTDRDAGRPRPTALMSTRSGFHGDTPATAVPRATLVTAIEEVATLFSTETLPEVQLCHHLVAECTGGPFQVVGSVAQNG